MPPQPVAARANEAGQRRRGQDSAQNGGLTIFLRVPGRETYDAPDPVAGPRPPGGRRPLAHGRPRPAGPRPVGREGPARRSSRTASGVTPGAVPTSRSPPGVTSQDAQVGGDPFDDPGAGERQRAALGEVGGVRPSPRGR